jgi:hypothetical protein
VSFLSFYLHHFTAVFGGKSEATLARLASLEGVSYSPQAIVSPEAVLSPQDMEDTIEEAEMFRWENGANNVPTKVAASASKSLFKSSSESIAPQEERKRKTERTYEVYEEKVRVSANELVLAISFTLLSSNTNILYSDV